MLPFSFVGHPCKIRGKYFYPLMEQVMKLIKRFKAWVISKRNQLWNWWWLRQELKKFSIEDALIVQPLLSNQLRYYDNAFQQQPPKRLMLDLAVRVIKNTLILDRVIGIQPMAGPVDQKYVLQYRVRPDNTPTMVIEKWAVEAKSRKVKARFSLETAQDLYKIHGVDVQHEMSAATAAEVSREIITEMLQTIERVATESNQVVESKYQTSNLLLTEINMLANRIAATTRRGAGNVIITTPRGLALLEETIKLDKSKVSHPGFGALRYVGDINLTPTEPPYDALPKALYEVFTSDTIVELSDEAVFFIGWRGGGTAIDTGLVYCPYVPLMSIGPVINPATFAPEVQFMTRYGIIENSSPDVHAGNYYGILKVKVDNQ